MVEPPDPKGWVMGLLGGVIALLLTVLGWVWARFVGQQDRHGKRFVELEKYLNDYMAKKGDVEYLAKQIDATNVSIAANEKKTSDFRHDLRDETNYQSLVLYLIAKNANIDLPPRDLSRKP
jgi:hypothetical protein